MKIYLFLLLSISSFRNQKVSGNEMLVFKFDSCYRHVTLIINITHIYFISFYLNFVFNIYLTKSLFI
jgi:hypothetical protein